MTEGKQRLAAAIIWTLAALAAVGVGVTADRPALRAAPADVQALMPPEGSPYLLDLNTATEEELQTLPGIGPVLAEAITQQRSELGGFRSREDILSVRGIGEATLEGILPYITY